MARPQKRPTPRERLEKDAHNFTVENAGEDALADILKSLEQNCKKLEKRYEAAVHRARHELGDMGFWGAVGAVAMVADLTIMGGIGTALAVWSGAGFLAYNSSANQVGKELKRVRERIEDMQQARFEAQLQKNANNNTPQPAAPEGKNLSEEFSPAARAEIEALRDKLAKLENQVTQLQDEKEKGLDKPKFKKPFTGKKPGDQ